jgi:iron complex outermembrane receptor protein
MISSKRLLFTLAVTVATTAMFVGPGAIQYASAQEDEEAQDSNLAIDEVIVTARKREERLLDIPLTISVLTATEIDIKGIDEMEDIVDFAPGFHYGGPSVGSGARSNRRLLMRGMQPSTDRQHAQAASILIDGAVVLGSEFGSMEGIERIEVVKGPQSAYFGRATFGGAINIITRAPNLDKWEGKLKVEAGSYDVSDIGLSFEGPLIADKLGLRVSASSMQTDGHYKNFTDGSRLGDRSTDDVQATFYYAPNEKFSAKLRLHQWQDDDGPGASVAMGLFNMQDVFNCNPEGSLALPIPDPETGLGNNNWVCGEPRAPKKHEIGFDVAVTDEQLQVMKHLNPDGTPLNKRFYMSHPARLKHAGLARDAYETSLSLNYEFDNGMSLQSILAKHQNESSTASDPFTRRATGLSVFGEEMVGCPFCRDRDGVDDGVPTFGEWTTVGIGLSDNRRADESAEIRLISAPDKRLTWSVGMNWADTWQRSGGTSYSYYGVPGEHRWSHWEPYDHDCATAGRQAVGPDELGCERAPSANGRGIQETSTLGVFASLGFAFTDQLTASVEGRYQEDEQTQGNDDRPDLLVNDTFYSVTPRVIIDYKPNEEMTIYGSWAKGTRAGTFNTSLRTVEDSPIPGGPTAEETLECIRFQTGADFFVPEEDLTNLEIGFKGRLMDGRATLTVAVYQAKWRDQQTRGIATCPGAYNNGELQESFAITGLGGRSDLSGVEIEAAFAATDYLTLEGTFAVNNSDILARNCADCLTLTGDAFNVVGNEYSRSPAKSGTFAASYRREVNSSLDFFARMDYIWKGSQWATDANIAETGARHRINARLGIQTEALRLEFYATNLTDDRTYTGFQRLNDFFIQNTVGIGGVGYNMLTGGLPEKRAYGIRATYDFDFSGN